jgi:hypothetical protein
MFGYSQFVRGLTNGRPLGIINVREFGAKGDGVTDDTEALQAAIAALPPYKRNEAALNDNGGGVLVFPPGKYVHSQTLRIKTNCALIGFGGADQTTTLELADGSNCDQLVIGRKAEDMVGDREPTTYHIQGLCFRMNRSAQAAGCSNIVAWNRLRHSHFHDLFIYGSTKHNLHMLNETGMIGAQNTYIYACSFEWAKEACVKLSTSYNTNILHSYAGFNAETDTDPTGFWIDRGSDVRINNCWMLDPIWGKAIYVYKSEGLSIIGCQIRGAGVNAIHLEETNKALINGNIITRTGVSAFKVPVDAVKLTNTQYTMLTHNMVCAYSNSRLLEEGTCVDTYSHGNRDTQADPPEEF